MGIGEDKVLMNIERYGNTTAATLPLLLWDYEKKIKKGDNLIFSAFGGGFTWEPFGLNGLTIQNKSSNKQQIESNRIKN